MDRSFLRGACFLGLAASLFSAPASLQGADPSAWPPMGPELIKRIELLPREREAVAAESKRIMEETKTEFGDAHVVKHWQPLLVVLIGRAENRPRAEALKRYESLMDDLGLFTQAALEGESGLLSAAGSEYARPAREATENLLAYFVRCVMVPEHWDIEEWSAWSERWRGESSEPDDEDTDGIGEKSGAPSALLGHWEGNPEMVHFAHAVVTPWRLLLIWQESEGSPARKIDLPIYRCGEERIYSEPDDVGLPYLLGRDDEGREILHFEVRSEDPDVVNLEIGLFRAEMPAVER
jgi:uncharacterized protein (UPF0335 family)